MKHLRKDWLLILIATKSLKEANYNEIADWLHIPELAIISRRLKEMEKLNFIEKTGKSSLTKRNKSARIYRICAAGEKEIYKNLKPSIQKSLF